MIRLARPEDWLKIRDLCCLTGNGGASIDRARWAFFAEHWVGPYQKLLPGWTWVAVDDRDRVQGYLTACPDTLRFRRAKRWHFTPRLMRDVWLGRYLQNGDTQRFVKRAIGLDRGPEELFPKEVRKKLDHEYPAHLHMNVDSFHRSSGFGKHLIEACFSGLRQKQVAGIHLFCGPKPLAFYQRHGFQEISRLEFRPGVWVYALAAQVSQEP